MGSTAPLGFPLPSVDPLHVAAVAATLAAIYLGYRLVAGAIDRLREEGRFHDHAAFTVKKLFQVAAALLAVVAVASELELNMSLLLGLLALSGGTIVGFAASDTIGNALAGMVIMATTPFRVGDRILYEGQLADVVEINFIYTRLTTLDRVEISVPNSKLLSTTIVNYGRDKPVRMACRVSIGYDTPPGAVEEMLLAAARRTRGVAGKPAPYVWVTGLGDYAAEYTLYVFTREVRRYEWIQAELYRNVLLEAAERGIDLSTPLLISGAPGQQPQG